MQKYYTIGDVDLLKLVACIGIISYVGFATKKMEKFKLKTATKEYTVR
jgi:hypothetical protein